MSCRLPQTPRTPTVGLDHYFDEAIRRHSISYSKPPRLRRASTARSIGARSDFHDQSDAQSAVGLGIRGDDHDRDGDDEGDSHAPEVDPRLHSYVAEQLERYSIEMNGRGGDGYDPRDEEFEATP